MLIWKRTTYFGKSKHVAEVAYDKQSGGVSVVGVIHGPKGGAMLGTVGLTVGELDEIRNAIATGMPVIKEG